jgi:sulfur relay (sulfurtransferase) complex TusBCD TusD component (DsrE family)
MATITVVISNPPYGRLNALAGLRFATQALKERHKVNVFFMQDGVLVPKKDTPEGLPAQRFDVRGWLNRARNCLRAVFNPEY